MWRCPCVPRTVYDFLYPSKPSFSLRASAPLCDLLLASGGHHPRSGRGHAQRVVPLFASASVVLGTDPYAPFR